MIAVPAYLQLSLSFASVPTLYTFYVPLIQISSYSQMYASLPYLHAASTWNIHPKF